MISTIGRYALRIMIDLAENSKDKYIPMKDVALRQGISLKYTEKIMPRLKAAGLVEGVHGKGGGYKLLKAPKDYSVAEILLASGEKLYPVACLCNGAPDCGRKESCKTLPVWKEFGELTEKFFETKTLENLM